MKQKKKKLLFLDVDDVLKLDLAYWNHIQFAMSKIMRQIDYVTVKRLKKIIDKTGSEIVVSFDHNILDENMTSLKACFAVFGLQIMSMTHQIPYSERGDEITAWFKDHPAYKDANYVILDSDEYLNVHMGHRVKIDIRRGLKPSQVEQIIRGLNHKERCK